VSSNYLYYTTKWYALSIPFAYQFAKLTPPNAKVLRRQSVNKGQAYWHFIPNLGIQKWFDFSKAHRVRESEQWYRRGEGVGNQGRSVFSTPAAVPCLCATAAMCVCMGAELPPPTLRSGWPTRGLWAWQHDMDRVSAHGTGQVGPYVPAVQYVRMGMNGYSGPWV